MHPLQNHDPHRRRPASLAIKLLPACAVFLTFISCSEKDKEPETANQGGKATSAATADPASPGGTGTPDPGATDEAAVEDPLQPGLAERPPQTAKRNFNPTPQGTPYSTYHWPSPASATDDEKVGQFLNASDAEQRIALIRENRSADNPSLAPMLRRALQGHLVDVRREAVQAAPLLDPADATDILSAATNDDSLEVATEALASAGQTEDLAQLDIYRNGMKSEHASIRLASVVEFTNKRHKYHIHDAFPSLDDEDPGVRQATSDALAEIFGERFETSASAEAWWGGKSDQFAPDLTLEPSGS